MIVMPDERTVAPDSTAVRTVMWRAMHVQIDPPPHVFEDEIGLKLAALDEGWRNRRDMNPQGTRRFRAAIVARARFVEDLVTEQASCGVGQYVIILVFEVDRPGPQEWKHQRLLRARLRRPLDVHSFLHVVPVDFEAGAAWWERLVSASFETSQPAVVASTGVSMYLTKDATASAIRAPIC
jgi:O-methyltransferase involved in polyketide biosynthesis